jgi:hypothetical protein
LGSPPTGARRGWPRAPTVARSGRRAPVCTAARGRAPVLRRRTDPPSDWRTDGGRLGARARRTTGKGPPVHSGCARQLGARGIPGVQGLGRRVAAVGRRGLPREHALRRRWPAARRARRTGRRDVAARPRSGAARFRLSHFEHDFLPKLEYKCTKQ